MNYTFRKGQKMNIYDNVTNRFSGNISFSIEFSLYIFFHISYKTFILDIVLKSFLLIIMLTLGICKNIFVEWKKISVANCVSSC